MNETDIPCSDCGTVLLERTFHAQDLPVATALQGHVRIAECPTCEARYYPEQTLSQLTGSTNNPQPRGDS
jgi:hypothetical protein